MESIVKKYGALSRDDSRILLFAGIKFANLKAIRLLRECMNEALAVLKPCVCYKELDRKEIESFFEYAKDDSSYRKYMAGCSKALVFAATLGNGIDELISNNSQTNQEKSNLFNAIGDHQLEELCDSFNMEMRLAYPGSKIRYKLESSDLDPSCKKLIFDLLSCSEKIGLSLNDKNEPSQSKCSIAFICIKDKQE